CIQRTDAGCFAPAACVDPEYADLFYEALAAGVEAWPYVAPPCFPPPSAAAPSVAPPGPAGIGLGARLPVRPA
ncbi:MAG: DNA/RNA nuclease SfsA, partial [Desulfovibrionaceae bacterium]